MLWRMPLVESYESPLESEVADMKNIGKTGRRRGSIVAGLILQRFTDGRPWAHLDIAGPSRAESNDGYYDQGRDGVQRAHDRRVLGGGRRRGANLRLDRSHSGRRDSAPSRASDVDATSLPSALPEQHRGEEVLVVDLGPAQDLGLAAEISPEGGVPTATPRSATSSAIVAMAASVCQ